MSNSSVMGDLDAWDDVVSRFVDIQRRRAALDAEQVRLLAEAVEVVRGAEVAYRGRPQGDRSIPLRSLVADLAVAGQMSELTVRRHLNDAADLCWRYPVLVDAMEQGDLSRRQVAIVHEAGATLPGDEDRDRFLQQALPVATQTTPGRLGPIVQAIAAQVDPRTLQERQHEAHQRRKVWLRNLTDGTCQLTAVLPAATGKAAFERLTRLAHAVTAPAAEAETDSGADTMGGSGDAGAGERVDQRTHAQVMADVVADLLLAGTPQAMTFGDAEAAIRPHIQITIPALTAAGVSDQPAVLEGIGPIDTDTARRLLGNAKVWDRVLTHPVTGTVIAVDRYRPGPALQRLLIARDEHCRFPGCRRQACHCDIDHTIDAATGGDTSVSNLAHLCCNHHTLKHHGAWRVIQLPGGILQWTSPSGRTTLDTPDHTLRFTPTNENTDPEHHAGEQRGDGPPGNDPPGPRTREWYARLHYDPATHGSAPF